MSNMRLSVVTVSWQTGSHLMECVNAVLGAEGVDELVLVNHANPRETTEQLRALADEHANFKLIETGANLGFSKGCNIGARAATGDLVLFLNPDAVLGPSAVERLKKSAQSMQASPWIIGARVLNHDGSEQRGARRGELTPKSALVSFLGLQRLLPGVQSIHWEGDAITEAMHSLPTVSGAAMMMRREDFHEIGGFDERYFLHVEDIDICRTVRERGGEVWTEPRANILHYGATSRSSRFIVETHKALGFVKYFWKFYPGPLQRLATLALVPPIFGALWGRVVWLAIVTRIRAMIRRREAMARLRRIRSRVRTERSSDPIKGGMARAGDRVARDAHPAPRSERF